MRPLRLGVVAALACLLTSAGAGQTAAAETGSRLALLAIGQTTSYFDLTMRPGTTRTLEVEVSNDGDARAEAHTYAADVYTLVNGGFGGRLRDEPTSGTTRWLDYAPDELDLLPGDRLRRTFSITVPDDAAPGEYITSVVLETSPGTAIGADPIERQALGVVVTVPGARSPALEIGDAAHLVLAGMSVVSVEVSNPGNVRIQPMVQLVLRNSAGDRLSEASVQMDSFYADTDTTVELPIGSLLAPDVYSVHLIGEDSQQGVRSTARLSFAVVADSPIAALVEVPIFRTTMDVAGTEIPVVLMVGLLGAISMVAGTMRVALRRSHGMRRS